MGDLKKEISARAGLLSLLREHNGKTLSAVFLAEALNVSRVSVWKQARALQNSGYPISTGDAGYSLNPDIKLDFVYPWEFAEKEKLFRFCRINGGSTKIGGNDENEEIRNKAREIALASSNSKEPFLALIADKRHESAQSEDDVGSLSCSFIEKPFLERHLNFPFLSLADYRLILMIWQISLARTLTELTGKKALIIWPCKIELNEKIAANFTTDLMARGDFIEWIICGFQTSPIINYKDNMPVLRKKIILSVIQEANHLKTLTMREKTYAQGNRLIQARWNSLARGIGENCALVISDYKNSTSYKSVIAKGIFLGVDAIGRCVIKNKKGIVRHFNPGGTELLFLGNLKQF